jgi:hypothetical protein
MRGEYKIDLAFGTFNPSACSWCKCTQSQIYAVNRILHYNIKMDVKETQFKEFDCNKEPGVAQSV